MGLPRKWGKGPVYRYRYGRAHLQILRHPWLTDDGPRWSGMAFLTSAEIMVRGHTPEECARELLNSIQPYLRDLIGKLDELMPEAP